MNAHGECGTRYGINAVTKAYLQSITPFVAAQALMSKNNIAGIFNKPVPCNPSLSAIRNVGINGACCMFGQVLNSFGNCVAAPACPRILSAKGVCCGQGQYLSAHGECTGPNH